MKTFQLDLHIFKTLLYRASAANLIQHFKFDIKALLELLSQPQEIN